MALRDLFKSDRQLRIERRIKRGILIPRSENLRRQAIKNHEAGLSSTPRCDICGEQFRGLAMDCGCTKKPC